MNNKTSTATLDKPESTIEQENQPTENLSDISSKSLEDRETLLADARQEINQADEKEVIQLLEERLGELEEKRERGRQLIQEQVEKKLYESRFSYYTVDGEYAEIEPGKDYFGLDSPLVNPDDNALLVYKGDNPEALARLSPEMRAHLNNLEIARRLGFEVDGSTSPEELASHFQKMSEEGTLHAEQPRGTSMLVAYKDKQGNTVAGFVPLSYVTPDQLSSSYTGALSNDGLGLRAGFQHTRTLKETPQRKETLTTSASTGLRVDEGGTLNVGVGVGVRHTDVNVEDGYIRTEQKGVGVGVNTSSGVSAGVSFEQKTVNPYNGDSSLTRVNVGVNPTGVQVKARVDISDDATLRAGLNQIPLSDDFSIPAPVAYAAVTIRGQKTPWLDDKRGYKVAYTGNDEEPIVTIGAAAVPGGVFPLIIPGEGLYPDRVIEYTPHMKEMNVTKQASQARQRTGQTLYTAQYQRAQELLKPAGDDLKMPQGESAIHMLGNHNWKRFPLSSQSFEEYTGVKAIDESGEPLISRDEALDAVVKQFLEDNPGVASRVKTDADANAIRTYLSAHVEYPEIQSADQLRDQGAQTRIRNPHIDAFTLKWNNEFETRTEFDREVLYLQGSVDIVLREKVEDRYGRNPNRLPEYKEDTITLTFEGRVDQPGISSAETRANAEKVVLERIHRALQEGHNMLSDGDFQRVSPERMKELQLEAVQNILAQEDPRFKIQVLPEGVSRQDRFKEFVETQHTLAKEIEAQEALEAEKAQEAEQAQEADEVREQ